MECKESSDRMSVFADDELDAVAPVLVYGNGKSLGVRRMPGDNLPAPV